MIVCDVVEELLGVESATEEECKVAISCFYDVGNLVDGLATVKGVCVSETVLDAVGGWNAVAESLCDAGEEGGVHDGRSALGETGRAGRVATFEDGRRDSCTRGDEEWKGRQR